MADRNEQLAVHIRAFIEGMREMGLFADKLDDIGEAADDATGGPDKLTDSLDDLGAGMAGAGSQARNLLPLLKGLIGLGLAKEFFDYNREIEANRQTLELLTGSADEAEQELTFLREEANRLGIEFQVANKSYTDMLAAAKGTPLVGEPARRIWSAVSEAMARMGKSSYDTEGALQAIQQIMSKGVVSSEELRQQLGERLPGALNIAADAVGVTTQELNAMLARGEVLAEDFLPKFASELEKRFGSGGDIDNANAGLARLKNAFTDMADEIGKTGLFDAAKDGLNGMTTAVNFTTLGIVGLMNAITATGQTIGTLVAAIETLDFSRLTEDIATYWERARAETQETAERLFDVEIALDGTITKANQAGAAMQGTAGFFVQASNDIRTAAQGMSLDMQLALDGLSRYVDNITAVPQAWRAIFSGLQQEIPAVEKTVVDAFETILLSSTASLEEIQAAFEATFKQVSSDAGLQALRNILDVAFQKGIIDAKAFSKLLDEIEDKAQDTGDKVADAFEYFGLVSRRELQRVATEARTAFATLEQSGQASTDQLKRAWLDYAAKAIAANDGVISKALRAEASSRGLLNELLALAKAAEEAGRSGDSLNNIGDTADKQRGPVRSLISDLQQLQNIKRDVDSDGAPPGEGPTNRGNADALAGYYTAAIEEIRKIAGDEFAEAEEKRLAGLWGRVPLAGFDWFFDNIQTSIRQAEMYARGGRGGSGVGVEPRRTIEVKMPTGGSYTLPGMTDDQSMTLEELLRALVGDMERVNP